MRILQLIDSLDAGGAERMAVNYANALVAQISFSALVATRKEGALKSQLSDKAGYLFLNKKGTIGFGAVLKLKRFVKQHNITIIHAHSTSFFTAVLLKMIYPKIKIIWHDHYGNSEFLEKRNSIVLKICSRFFFGTISVNRNLKRWSEQQLNCNKAIYLPNFVFFNNKTERQTILKGENYKRIVCLANLREQKNHELLLKIAKEIKNLHPDWTFHLVGKDFEDAYSQKIKNIISTENLEDSVFVYGSKTDIQNILEQAEIGILTSKSEGLPVALLEYGFCAKAVVVTHVGEIPTVITDTQSGILVDSGNAGKFVKALCLLIENPGKRNTLGNNLQQNIQDNYSREAVINTYLRWLKH